MVISVSIVFLLLFLSASGFSASSCSVCIVTYHIAMSTSFHLWLSHTTEHTTHDVFLKALPQDNRTNRSSWRTSTQTPGIAYGSTVETADMMSIWFAYPRQAEWHPKGHQQDYSYSAHQLDFRHIFQECQLFQKVLRLGSIPSAMLLTWCGLVLVSTDGFW